jgi:hypothetical protein
MILKIVKLHEKLYSQCFKRMKNVIPNTKFHFYLSLTSAPKTLVTMTIKKK